MTQRRLTRAQAAAGGSADQWARAQAAAAGSARLERLAITAGLLLGFATALALFALAELIAHVWPGFHL